MIDANGNRAQFVYDGLDSQTRWVFPSATRPTGYNPASQATALATAGAVNAADYEEYGYDANGNRTSLRKRDGSLLTYRYDALNRVTAKLVPERGGLDGTHTRDVFYGYDLLGRQLFARFDSAGGPGVANVFDGFGRLISSTLNLNGGWTVSHGFDANGNQTAITHPDGAVVTTSYDGLDRPTLIQRPGAVNVASYGYNTSGRRTAFGTGVNTGYGYDPAGRINTLTNTPAANVGLTNTWSFGFNPAGQIDTLTRSNDAFAFGQLYTVTRPYTANGLNQYTTAGAASFTYDANGNLTNDGSTGFTYDVENRLVAASGTKNAALRYDPLGRLYEVTGNTGTTRFLWDGDALLAEYDAAGTLLRRYVHGADAKADDPIAWYEGSTMSGTAERILRPDWQGSIVLATDSTGANALALNTYDEWGIPGAANQGRFQYTGQAWIPELGLYHYKARFYSPTLGRFLQVDPIGYEDQFNLYGYVGNDPVNGVDPTGMFNFGCTTNERGEAPNGSCSLASVAEDMLSQRQQTASLGKEGGTSEGRTTAAVAGAAVGLGVGVLAAGACDGASAMACTPADPAILSGAMAGGSYLFVLAYDTAERAKRAASAIVYEVHANSDKWRGRVEVYHLINRSTGAIDKIGCTCNPGSRYSDLWLITNNVRYQTVQSYSWRYPAKVHENIELVHYRLTYGSYPRLNKVAW